MDMHLGGPASQNGGPPWLIASPEHSIALLGLLFLPVLLVSLAVAIDLLASRFALVAHLKERVSAASTSTHLAVLLMLVTAEIHLVLVPVHLHDPVRAGLFLLDGGAFIGVCALAYTSVPWRAMAAMLSVATIGAYFFYLAAGFEDPDLVGVVSKVVEAGALITVAISAIAAHRDAGGDPGTTPGRKQPRSHPGAVTSQPQEVLG